jgi:hypothetical protein
MAREIPHFSIPDMDFIDFFPFHVRIGGEFGGD